MEVADTSIIDSPLEKYELAELLGQGSSGSTYRAIRLADQTSVAIKILSLRHLQDWKQLELFEREAKVLSQLSHPQIPQYLDYFHVDTPDNRAFYIVQQLAPGKPLTEWVQSGWRGTEVEIKDIARQLLEILKYLHQQSPPLVHRDIKPHNIIRNDDGRVFLVDFGAVQNVYRSTFLKGSTVAGTYGYMAPEQFRGAAVPASDLYGVGSTVLYLLTHRSPAELPQERLKLSFRSHVNISQHFADWLEIMLEPDVIDRFPSTEKASVNLQRRYHFWPQHTTKNKFSWKSIAVYTVSTAILIFLYHYRYAFLTPIHIQPKNICSADSSVSSVSDYLDHGGNINATMEVSWPEGSETYGYTYYPLVHCAIKFNKTEILKNLLVRGADPNIYSYNPQSRIRKETPLHLAIFMSGKQEIVKTLLDNGANSSLLDQDGNSPLHNLAQLVSSSNRFQCLALTEEKLRLFNIFMKYKVSPQLENNDGDTALHIVARKEDSVLYKHMISLGWNPLQKNKKGETAEQLMKSAINAIPQCEK
jgi:serine/threonine protein kinase